MPVVGNDGRTTRPPTFGGARPSGFRRLGLRAASLLSTLLFTTIPSALDRGVRTLMASVPPVYRSSNSHAGLTGRRILRFGSWATGPLLTLAFCFSLLYTIFCLYLYASYHKNLWSCLQYLYDLPAPASPRSSGPERGDNVSPKNEGPEHRGKFVFSCQPKDLPFDPVPGARVLFVIAHPDDEVLFFAPTILYLNKLNYARTAGSYQSTNTSGRLGAGVSIHLMCLSYGGYNPYGASRRTELYASCRTLGIPLSNLILLDLKDDPSQPYNPAVLANVIARNVRNHFDSFGPPQRYGYYHGTEYHYGYGSRDGTLSNLTLRVNESSFGTEFGLGAEGYAYYGHDRGSTNRTSHSIIGSSGIGSLDYIFTFDGYGVSGHVNHVAIPLALSYLAQNSSPDPTAKWEEVPVYVLDSVPVLRKYVSLLDLPLSFHYSDTGGLGSLGSYAKRYLRSLITYHHHYGNLDDDKDKPATTDRSKIGAPPPCRLPPSFLILGDAGDYAKARTAFKEHRSQQTWYRTLYTLFSRYMFFNTWTRMEFSSPPHTSLRLRIRKPILAHGGADEGNNSTTFNDSHKNDALEL